MLSKKGIPPAISNAAESIKERFSHTVSTLKKTSPTNWLLWLSPVLLAIVIWVPHWQAEQGIKDPNNKDSAFEIENKARTTIVQTVGGVFLFVTALSALRNAKAAEDNRKIAEDKQVSERFTKAAEMLADKDSLEVRVAGIYALERIARDSDSKDHWTVMEVLSFYIREKSVLIPKQTETLVEHYLSTKRDQLEQKASVSFPRDLQAALTVIGRRDSEKDAGNRLDLRGVNFFKAHLHGFNLSRVDFIWANLKSAILIAADLEQADLDEADLDEAKLICANLSGANLSGASLRGAWLEGANLYEANLVVVDLKMADLKMANLEGSCLMEANLREADFKGTNLRGAKNIKLDQVKRAFRWQEAIYDLGFAEQLGLDKEEQIRRAKKWDEEHRIERTQ